ncbi:MAG: sigma-54-dependent Fis family transcriptional regulator [Candidatus Sumerlaeia bacterium]|nr:sigma-54-dependent Fis family transcriptional regulator [Candidatus Sumerlaeia bacterium]
MPRQTLLVVDDEPDFITGFRRVLTREDLEILSAQSGEEALEIVRVRRPDVIFMDLRMPGLDGLATLKRMREMDSRLIVVLMTAYSTTSTIIEAMKHGAFEFLGKPFSGTKLREVASEALKVANDMRTVVSYRPQAVEGEGTEAIVGNSDAMQRVYKAIGQVAASNATVLITGESGTGKELVARAIYHHSDRSGRPFIAVNCAAIPESLLESELFGHEKGAFTGAVGRKPGKFEVAQSGTIFLDEIGDMSLSTQTKILRVLQDGSFQRVGGTETLKADIRVLAATNRDLPRMIREGAFRSDLYYRLNVVHIEMPTLAERAEDIPLLVDYFLRRLERETRRKSPAVSAAAMQMLQGYSWPGNVRELENVLRNLVLTAKTDTVMPGDLRLRGELGEVLGSRRTPGATEATGFGMPATAPPPDVPTSATAPQTGESWVVDAGVFRDIETAVEPLFDQMVEARGRGYKFSAFDVMERAMILHALNKMRGNQVQAAKALGITRSTLRKRIARYGLKIDTRVRG